MRKKYKEKFFGEWIQELREEKGWTVSDVVGKLQMAEVTEKHVKRWEKNIEFPELRIIYKISEVYSVPATELLSLKEETLKFGINGIHKRIILWISRILGLSVYGTIILCRIIIFLALVITFIWFINIV